MSQQEGLSPQQAETMVPKLLALERQYQRKINKEH